MACSRQGRKQVSAKKGHPGLQLVLNQIGSRQINRFEAYIRCKNTDICCMNRQCHCKVAAPRAHVHNQQRLAGALPLRDEIQGRPGQQLSFLARIRAAGVQKNCMPMNVVLPKINSIGSPLRRRSIKGLKIETNLFLNGSVHVAHGSVGNNVEQLQRLLQWVGKARTFKCLVGFKKPVEHMISFPMDEKMSDC